jgi:hypothetical protein
MRNTERRFINRRNNPGKTKRDYQRVQIELSIEKKLRELK